MELAYFPYLCLSKAAHYSIGRAHVWHADQLQERVSDQRVREKIGLILSTHVGTSHFAQVASPVSGIGLATVGTVDCRAFSHADLNALTDLRYALFLAALSSNNRFAGPNAGHWIFTAENFTLIRQSFELEGDYFSEVAGVIVQMTELGHKFGSTKFPRPSHVPWPTMFQIDEELWQALRWVRNHDRAFYRRIIRAAGVFLESYYNTPAVDISARVLLQVVAFEILLDLPEQGQRKKFKEEIGARCSGARDRRFSYTFEIWGHKHRETRTLAGIWAERFYSLRNHIIHGTDVGGREYLFRGRQHHLQIAPMMFTQVVKSLLNESFRRENAPPRFCDRITWESTRDDQESDAREGFRIRPDFHALAALRDLNETVL